MNVNENLMIESVIQIKSGIKINVGASIKTKKKHRLYKKDYIWNPPTCSCENGKYLARINNDSVITCDEIKEETKTVATNFNEKNVICKTKNFFILLVFLLITITLLIAVSIYCYLIKCKS